MIADDYMRNGGYLETIPSRSITKSYLSTLFDSILLKDVAKRHNVRNTTDLYNLATYLLSNFCNPLSTNDLAMELGLSSVVTTKKFCDYLNKPYLFFYLPRFNNKEINLVTHKGTRIEQLIQVCYNMTSGKNRKRELDALVEACEDLRCNNLLIITNGQQEEIDWKKHKVKVVNVVIGNF